MKSTKLKYSTVLFDLDGTIIDTNELILTSFQFTLDQFYPGKYTRADIIPYMGDTLYKQMERFGAPDDVEALVETYREHNEKVHDQLVKEFPQVAETIKTLHQMGVRMGIVTTKQRKTTMMGLNLFGLTPYMEAIITYQDVEHHKPHPEPILKAISQMKAIPEETLMVGDSQYDMMAAKAAGVSAAGVAWSMKGADFLHQFHPDYMLESIDDLILIVSGK
ncbi:pyrophosphatase PpaX [Microaerobacter geothermalis]|uniref:pyrophosphatase PpaX n=1 Tax=Microaerobacter geothermalis TaxID=674972 RepID=UPI001F4411C8|nr:pyrophosphatase PpaX [Microaerobacter geothermalis]MCF6094564.1 pyrophosphatase PpaX [Microaerobacter geothermalis]